MPARTPNTRARIAQLLEAYGSQSRYLGIFAVVAVVLALCVVQAFSLRAITMTLERAGYILVCGQEEGEGHTHTIECYARDPNAVVFDANNFSTYAIVSTTLERRLTVADGTANSFTYAITVTCPPDAGVPKGASLDASEIAEGDSAYDKSYDEYIAETEGALGWDEGSAGRIRLFDIRIVDAQGEKVELTAPVSVEIRLADMDVTEETQVVHFPEGSAAPDVVSDVEVSGEALAFETEGFSAYAIVEGPVDIPIWWSRLATMDDLRTHAATGVYIGTTGGYYLRNITAIGTKDASTTGIVKTTPTQSYPSTEAAVYYFEPVSGSSSQFYAYCLASDGSRQYVRNTGDQNLYLTTNERERTAFEVLVDGSGRFRFHNGNRYWNMWNGANGNHIAAWTTASDANNYFYLWEHVAVDGDQYGLAGLSYGLISWDGDTMGKALMANASSASALEAKPLTVLSRSGDNDDKLFVPNDSDISLWTFQWVASDTYYLTTTIDGSLRYLRVAAEGLTLVSEPDDACIITVTPGSGIHAGEISLSAAGRTLCYSGAAETGFIVGGTAGSEWLMLAELSELTSEYFMTHSAAKVSVSDPSIETGSRIIVYARSWNETTKKYEFYAIGHDGKLVRCFESGDVIQWTGTLLNNMLWNFVEYKNDDGTPSYFYELYNQYSEKYLAPQITGGQILSDETIGINMNGRRNGRYYSPIVAWDDGSYAYAGLKVENGQIVSCPISEADDFYFAVMQDIPVDDELTLVPTVDHTAYGITMRMFDFPGTTTTERSRMSAFFGDDTYRNGNATQGLLSTNLGADGYPTIASSGSSLATLYASGTGTGSLREVNHLFIASTYRGTGYFEFDSMQNFASLDTATGDFKVYGELGAVDESSNNFGKHGQFMPYNDIVAGLFSSVNPKNLYDMNGRALSESDPRKYEKLYLAKNANYLHGMELEASFVQTPDGLDDWGHDIIYEFTGDDDFWLYVDGELVIDLGGIHDALAGSVNYRTGEVVVNGSRTTLRAIFEKNYRARNPRARAVEVERYLDQFFESGSTVFRDYSTHTMRIFYLERGRGASNLHMRFNLASVKPGTVQLSKELSGVDATESILAEFPYQIYYKAPGDATERRLTNSVAGTSDTADYVFYKDTTTPVRFEKELTVDGITYEDVFLLKPGETAEIEFPTFGADNAIVESYSVVECGVNTEVYQRVSANGVELAATNVPGHAGRADYALDWASTGDRARVSYVNEVDPDALRTITITKQLFREDGVTRIDGSTDSTTFSFRLYLGTEFDGDLPLANMHTYHVRDERGNYCVWDTTNQVFVSLGKADYASLTAEEKEAASFTTSMSGAISKIPVDYTVEVREVLAGTRFRVQERPWEIPDGYSFQKYIYNRTDYTDAGVLVDAETGVLDTIVSRRDAEIVICNLKGWGLRVRKEWSDSAYMTTRDPVYFAVFTGASDESLKLVEGTVRQMIYGESTLYWYFPKLPVNVPFDQYWIREVTITAERPEFNEDGVVTNPGTVTPIAEGGELVVEGMQKGETATSDFTYTALYTQGELSAEANVRVDRVTNNRPGIVLRKADWQGNALAGATFTLTDADGNLIGTFTSDATGQVTVAFLRDDVAYTLTETKVPQGYLGLPQPMTITLHDGNLSIEGVGETYYVLEQGSGTPSLTIKNRPHRFRAIKIDGGTGQPMEGVTFALHRQVTVDGVTDFDLNPMVGYEELLTGVDGTIPKLTEALPAGTYQLRETDTLVGYEVLSGYIVFTVSQTGEVTLDTQTDEAVLGVAEEAAGTLIHTLTVRNVRPKRVSVWKTDLDHNALTGASFALWRAEDFDDTTGAPIEGKEALVRGIVDDKGLLQLGELSNGEYRLVETEAPEGFVAASGAIKIQVTTDAVTAWQSERPAEVTRKGDAHWVNGQEATTWQVRVWNNPGVILPHTGGPGTGMLYVLGLALVVASCAVALRHVRRRA